MPAVLFRYTNDLRIDGHRGIEAAAELGPVLPVFIIDRALEATFAQSPRRAEFVLRALDALVSDFERIGHRLIIRRGPAGASLRRLARAVDAHTVVWTARYDPASQHADARLQAEL